MGHDYLLGCGLCVIFLVETLNRLREISDWLALDDLSLGWLGRLGNFFELES